MKHTKTNTKVSNIFPRKPAFIGYIALAIGVLAFLFSLDSKMSVRNLHTNRTHDIGETRIYCAGTKCYNLKDSVGMLEYYDKHSIPVRAYKRYITNQVPKQTKLVIVNNDDIELTWYKVRIESLQNIPNPPPNSTQNIP